MTARRVNRSKARKDQRYSDAVRRQLTLLGTVRKGLFRAPIEEFLRPGDTAARYGEAPPAPVIRRDWAALNVQVQRPPAGCDSVRPCDPETGYQCRRCYIADDTAYERSLDV